MKPTTRSCHATRLLIELAHHTGASPLRAAALVATIGISIKLLEKIVRPLKTAGLLKSVRGASGGYVLGRAPAEISLADILTTMEGAVFKPQCCEADADCPLMDGCPTGRLWTGIARQVELRFRAATLADFLAQPWEACPSRRGRAALKTAKPDARPLSVLAKNGGRVSRRRKPGAGQSALRLHVRPRLA